MKASEHIEALAGEGLLLASAAEAAGVDASVPTCPEWAVRDLVRHTGGVHRWATTYVSDAVVDVIDDDLEPLVGGWPPDDELVPWFREGHALLVDALWAAPADLECFTFLKAPSPLQMWARRQAHETTIHRVDAEAAAGWLTPPSPDLASDGIDELLTCFITRRGNRFRLDPPRTIAVCASDAGTGWTVTIGPDKITTERSPSPSPSDAALTVTGEASSLYLWLWNRTDASNLTHTGDDSLLTAWRDGVRVRWS